MQLILKRNELKVGMLEYMTNEMNEMLMVSYDCRDESFVITFFYRDITLITKMVSHCMDNFYNDNDMRAAAAEWFEIFKIDK